MITQSGVANYIASNLEGFGGYLECKYCGVRINPLSKDRLARYMSKGWPRCCGYTMSWITKNMIEKGL